MDDEFLAGLAILLGDEVAAGFSGWRQDEYPVLALGGLDVAVLALGGVR